MSALTVKSRRAAASRGVMPGSNVTANPLCPGAIFESRRGTVSISDVASWIEQRLDAPKFLRKLFCRFSRSTPWIIFRHELDEMIRGRVTGIDLILRMMDDASADILPFARFCGEASHGRLAIVFAEVFLASAVTFIFETTRAVNKPNIRSAGSGVSSLLRRGMSIST